jgi:hypothetical protein
VEGSIAEGGRDGAPKRKSGRKRHKAKQNPLFVRIVSKSVFPGCPRSAETATSRTRCFLL